MEAQECAELLKVLNTMGPEVTADQAYRWFDNRRNKKPTKVSSAMNDSGATTSHIMKTSRISKDEREMLETAYSSRLCAGHAQARSHRRRDWDLNAPGDKLVRATTGFTTSRDAALPLANVDHGGGDDIGLLSRGLVEGLLPGASTAGVQGGSQMTLMETLAAQSDLGLGIHHPELYGNLPTSHSPVPRCGHTGMGMVRLFADKACMSSTLTIRNCNHLDVRFLSKNSHG